MRQGKMRWRSQPFGRPLTRIQAIPKTPVCGQNTIWVSFMSVAVQSKPPGSSTTPSCAGAMLMTSINKLSSALPNSRKAESVGYPQRKSTRMMRLWIALLWLIWVSVSPALAEIYRWTDEAGKVHLTDNPDTIPPAYRARARSSRSGPSATDETPSVDVRPSPPQPLPADRTLAAQAPAPAAAPTTPEIAELKRQIAAADGGQSIMGRQGFEMLQQAQALKQAE